MTTTSFSDSLKYGGRMFGLFLAVVIVGGLMTVLGGYLAIPEISSYLSDGSSAVETATLAGGVVLTLIGAVVLFVGNFAFVYKLIADAVSTGVRNGTSGALTVPGDDVATAKTDASGDESTADEPKTLGPSPGEQQATTHGPEQTVPSASSEKPEPAQGEPAPASSQSGAQAGTSTDKRRTSQDGKPTAQSEQPRGADESSPAQAERQQTQDRQSTPDQQTTGEIEPDIEEPTKRERTAEEIAFGAGGDQPDEPRTAGETSVEEKRTQSTDDEWFEDDAESAVDGEANSQQQSTAADGNAMFEEDGSEPVEPEDEVFEEEETGMFEEPTEEPRDRSDIETANDSSADPLSDRFDG